MHAGILADWLAGWHLLFYLDRDQSAVRGIESSELVGSILNYYLMSKPSCS